MPGRRTLTATALRSPLRVDLRAVHLCDRCGGDGGSEACIKCRKRLVERGNNRCFGFALRKRRHLVLETFEVASDRRADDIRPRREKLSELDIGRPELGQSGGKAALTAFRSRPLDQPGKRDGGLGRQRQGPRIDQSKDTLARKYKSSAGQAEQMEEAEITIASPSVALPRHRSSA